MLSAYHKILYLNKELARFIINIPVGKLVLSNTHKKRLEAQLIPEKSKYPKVLSVTLPFPFDN